MRRAQEPIEEHHESNFSARYLRGSFSRTKMGNLRFITRPVHRFRPDFRSASVTSLAAARIQ